MADVFLAVARGPVGFNKLTVVKRLRNPDDKDHLEMFLDEARLSARLGHPNIVNTYEVGEEKGQYFIAMEYLEGQPLQAVLSKATSEEKPLDEAVAAFVAMQSLKGLHYAHELADYDGTPLNVVHRDVSPHNLFITYQGEVKLLDFGIAKATMNVSRTETGVLKGKARYMAPEQITERDVDRRADIFALGIVLWEMLAGKALFRGDLASVVSRLNTDDPPLLRTIRPDVSPELERIVAASLRRDPAARYPTADAMRADLEAFLAGRKDAADTALVGILRESFSDTREEVRARIKTFLTALPSTPSSGSAASLAAEADLLPVLFGDTGAGGSGSGSGRRHKLATTGSNDLIFEARLSSADASPVQSRRSWIWAAAGLAIALVVAVLVLRPKPATESAPSVGAATAAPSPPIASVGTVHLETSPAGASIQRDGRIIGQTPADVELPAGAQTLTLSADGYEPEDVTVDVKSGIPAARAIALRAKSPPATSSVASTLVRQPPRGSQGQATRPRPSQAPSVASSAPSASPSASAPKPKIRVVGEDEVQ
jgi:serine/threonine-protein kinase